MSVDYKQASCPACGSTLLEVERATVEELAYDESVIFVTFVMLYCVRCDTYISFYDAD